MGQERLEDTFDIGETMTKLTDSAINFLEYASSNKRQENKWSSPDDSAPTLDHRALSIDDPYWKDFYDNPVTGSPEQLKF